MANVVNADVILRDDSPFYMQEAYKNLRTNLHYTLPDDGCHVIGITSSNREEGKTTTAVNMAISFAQLGKSVIIVDCDLRIPSLAKMLNIPETPGLSDCLINDNTVNECLVRNREHKIYAIPAGHIPMEPTWLLQSKKMSALIEELRRKFDYVFIDLPPVGLVSDAQILSNVVDGYLVVVKNESTRHKELGATVNALQFVNANILGFILTSVQNTKSSYASKYYGYEYKSPDAPKPKKREKARLADKA